MKIHVGIDPMDQGAIAVIKGDEILLHDIPVLKSHGGRAELDFAELWNLLARMRDGNDIRVFIEKMQPMPLGSIANFKRGGYLYAFRMAFAGLGYSYSEVAPKQWQKFFSIARKENRDTKIQSYLVASRLFPDQELKTGRGKILDGRCDALLIAEFGRVRAC